MKVYWEIPGPSKAPQSACIAFYKHDGSNLRAEFSFKRGWYKFGTRNNMFDQTNPLFGPAIDVILNTYGESVPKVIKDNKKYRGVESFVLFCEFFGPSSFAGWHDVNEKEREVVMFDISLHKKGFVLPRDFINDFGHLRIPEVIYEGNFGKQFVEDVKEGKYPVNEGVVAKGVIEKKNPQHGLWMAKVKTKKWLEELKTRMESSEEFRRTLLENLREQDGY